MIRGNPHRSVGRRYRPSQPRLRPAVALAALVAVGAAMLAAPPGPAAAAPTTQPSGEAGAKPVGLDGVASETHQVTLITGDQVKLTSHGPHGPYETEVTPAERAGGQQPMFMSQVGPQGVYVVPSDVASAVQAGQVDKELFNVTRLVKDGYADDAAALPVILTYPKPAGTKSRAAASATAKDLKTRTDQLPATSDVVGLSSINGSGARVEKKTAADFWQGLRNVAGSALVGSGQPRIWLDGVAHVVLDKSVPLIGAPKAWAAGYDGTGTTVAVIDSGVDLNHPDLAGQVVAAESFVPGLPPQDGNGHGTHVASTIAGTGAASGGRYTGVAPGADLISGRVCNDAGNCQFSAMIAGIEWATQNMHADVVSMSIGGDPTDGTDPLSQAVNNLTASTGALFVIAAGNSGRDLTVGSPGTADAALTVAATDKSDRLASFSSRGPRFGDMALKPDIAAPGVDITAARADGTALGPIVDDKYTTISGTSMATPHVSGAAAILAQRYPDWSPQQLKAALMGTATDGGHTVYQQGAGRVDVGRAATQQVFATTTNLDFGIVVIPDDGAPEPGPNTRQVVYANQSDQPVTLNLTPTLTTTDGHAVPSGALTTDSTVTVPAGGTATVDVTLNVTGLGTGWYTGALVATDDATGTRLTTPVGLVREPPRATLTIRTLGRDGQPVTPGGTQLIDVSGKAGFITDLTAIGDGVTATRIPEGTYSVAQLVSWVDQESRLNAAWLLNPEVTVDGDTEIVLDARTATQVTFDTPQSSEPLSNLAESFYQRTTADGEPFAGSLISVPGSTGSWMRLWATPTKQVTAGKFRFASQWTLGQNATDMTVLDRSGPTLHPATPFTFWSDQGLVDNNFTDARQFRGTTQLPLVDVGLGTPEDLAGVDLTGKLALLEAGPVPGVFGLTCALDIRQIAAVRDAGAAGIVAFPSGELACPIPMPVNTPPFGPHMPIGIRYAFLPTGEGHALRDLLAAGPLTMQVTGAPAESPYLNVLKPYEEGRIPDSLHYTFTEKDLAVTDVTFHAAQPAATFESHWLWKQDDLVISATAPSYFGPWTTVPATKREYVGPVAPDLLYTHGATEVESDGFGHDVRGSQLENRLTVADVLDTPGHTREQWFTEPQTPGPAVASQAAYATVDPDEPIGEWYGLGNIFCALCREGNTLVSLAYMTAGSTDNLQHDNLNWLGDGPQYRLYRDGQEIHSTSLAVAPGFELPDGTGHYRLDLETPQTHASWWFTSSPPAEQARQYGYACLKRDLVQPSDEPCAPVPAVYVSYDLGDSLAMDNTVRAPGAQQFDVYAYHHPSPAPMPAIAGLKLWASYDGGDHWTPVKVQAKGNGRYQATLVHPPTNRRASDKVSLKVEAWDKAGNRLEQTTTDAFNLKP